MVEFRDPELAKKLQRTIESETRALSAPLRIMEFCGGHTISLLKYGILDLLPDNIEMVSGPGCPVCVTSKGEIDSAIKLAEREEVILTSFGDMIRVPGTKQSLRDAKAEGLDIRVVYSPNDAVKIAEENPGKKVVFFGVGFETTAPVTAASIKLAVAKGVKNYFVIGAHKTTPGVLEALLAEEVKIDAFICPGHVTTITGTGIYKILTDAGRPCVVSGFEPIDIMTSVLMAVRQINRGASETEIEYTRVATPEGNRHAQAMISDVFAPTDALWRGLGTIPLSGLKPRGEYERFDACKEFGMEITLDDSETKGCICGKILRGLNKPSDCKLFTTACTPDNPVGACMVSDEGTCSVYYRFGNKGKELVEV